MNAALICTALLGLLVFGLGIAVSLVRGSTNTVYGFTPDPNDRLYKLVRAHCNATEYAPMLAVLMLFLAIRGPSPWMVWTFALATLCRYAHAAGMIFFGSLAKPNPLRFVGALGTYVAGLALVVAAFMLA